MGRATPSLAFSAILGLTIPAGLQLIAAPAAAQPAVPKNAKPPAKPAARSQTACLRHLLHSQDPDYPGLTRIETEAMLLAMREMERLLGEVDR